MTRLRVYVPFTLDRLASLLESDEIGPAPFTGYAVTPDVVEQTKDCDDEEREYVVALAAARASLELVVSDPATPWRRVVLAVDVDQAHTQRSRTHPDPAAIDVTEAPSLRALAALLVDDAAAEPTVAIAAQTHDLDAADDLKLLWFAPLEITDLLS